MRTDPINMDIDLPSPAELVPEKQLILAVIERAVRDLFSPTKSERETAREWIDSDLQGVGTRTLSFAWCCDALSAEYEDVRRAIYRFEEAHRNTDKRGQLVIFGETGSLVEETPPPARIEMIELGKVRSNSAGPRKNFALSRFKEVERS